MEKALFTLAFARLTYLAITCPCVPLFACHATEAVALSAVTAAIIAYRNLISK